MTRETVIVAATLLVAAVLGSPSGARAVCECQCSLPGVCSVCVENPPCYAFCRPQTQMCDGCWLGPGPSDGDNTTLSGPRFSFTGGAEDLSEALSRALGSDVELELTGAALEPTRFVFKDMPVQQVLDSLTRVGEVKIDGVSHQPAAVPAEVRNTRFLENPAFFVIREASGEQISSLLSREAGLAVSFEPWGATTVSMEAKGLTGRQLLDLLSQRGRLTIDGDVWPLRR